MANTNLLHTKVAPDLGIKIHSTLRWNDHTQALTSKANQRLWLIIHTIIFDAHIKTRTLAYMALCRSILKYNMAVWSPSTKDNILALESVQRKVTNY